MTDWQARALRAEEALVEADRLADAVKTLLRHDYQRHAFDPPGDHGRAFNQAREALGDYRRAREVAFLLGSAGV